jgi:hypothetical protein
MVARLPRPLQIREEAGGLVPDLRAPQDRSERRHGRDVDVLQVGLALSRHRTAECDDEAQHPGEAAPGSTAIARRTAASTSGDTAGLSREGGALPARTNAATASGVGA